MTAPALRVGFIGLGLMGRALARHTLQRGHPVTLLVRHARDRDALAELLAAGAQAAALPSAMAAQCDVVVLCVTGAADVESIVFGQDGLLAASAATAATATATATATAGLRVVDCSTSLPETTRRCAAALAERGGAFIDAAMTGTPSDAEAGRLNLLLGGSDAQIAPLEPLLRLFARNLYRCGSTGAGHAVKLLHQFVVLSNAAVLAEAYALARQGGVDTGVLGDVIASGGANSTAFQRLRPYVDEGRDEMFRFTIVNALKDMRYYDSMAVAAGAGRRIGEAALCTYINANEMGFGGQYVPHLLDAAERENRTRTVPEPPR